MTVRFVWAMRTERSIKCRTCSGTLANPTNSLATSLKRYLQVDLLLIGGAESRARLLPNQCHHRHMVELGVVETVEEMNGTGTGGCEAKTGLPGEFRVRRCHEGRHFLVADLYVFHKSFGLFQGYIETADTVTRIAIDAFKAPFRQTLPDEFADVHAHVCRPDLGPPESLVQAASLLRLLC